MEKTYWLQNRIVHEYFGIDIEIIWLIVESDIEELLIQLEEITPDN